MQTVCVTGASGFIGRHLITELRKHPNIEIRGLVRAMPDDASSVHWQKGDLLEASSVHGFIKQGSVVIHLAYSGMIDSESNLRMALNLAEEADRSGARRFIHVSTAVVSESRNRSFNAYERSKLEIEERLTKRLEKSSCELVILRPTCVFGEGGQSLLKMSSELQVEPTWKAWLKASLLKKRALNLVYVGDVVEAILFLIQTRVSVKNQCFVVSEDDNSLNCYDFVSRYLRELFGLKSPPKMPATSAVLPLVFKIFGRGHIDPFIKYDPGMLLRLGYQRKYGLLDGLKRYAQWYRESHPHAHS